MNASAKLTTLLVCVAAAAAAGCSGSAPPTAPQPAETPATAAPVPAQAAAEAKAEPLPPVANPAPGFTLPGADGAAHSLADFRGKWVVLEWTNAKCPAVRKHYDTGNMQGLQSRYTAKDVVWLSICSSAPGKEGYQEPDGWKATIAKDGSSATAVLIDADGKVGHAYGAKATPHMVVIDPRGGIAYRGAIDDKKGIDKADVATAHNYVAAALDAGMAGRPVPVAETQAYG